MEPSSRSRRPDSTAKEFVACTNILNTHWSDDPPRRLNDHGGRCARCRSRVLSRCWHRSQGFISHAGHRETIEKVIEIKGFQPWRLRWKAEGLNPRKIRTSCPFPAPRSSAG